MSAEREAQLSRMVELMRTMPLMTTYEASADYLLDNGVTVDIPEPVIAPGTTGWATVKHKGLTAMSVHGVVALTADGARAFYYAEHDGYFGSTDWGQVAHFKSFGLSDRQRDVLRQALAPYVAKGGGPR